MQEYNLTGSTKTTSVNLSATSGVLELSGRSIPEIAIEFYGPIIDWLVDYSSNPLPETNVRLKFEYFNTSSSKSILDFIKKLELLHTSGKSKVNVKWFYEQDDEAMEEAGQEYKLLSSIPFEIVLS